MVEMMPKVLTIIRDEHRSIGAVLDGMRYLINEIRINKTRIDPQVFRAMVYYLDTFSERMHHPKEDKYLFSAMKKRGAEANAIVEDLEKEHAGGQAALKELEQCLIRYEEGGEKEFPAFSETVDRFVKDYWGHMRKEEDLVFPLAQKLLTPADWEVIDRAFEENRDPLAAERETKDFRNLFTRIVNLAPPPIGVGPSA